MVHYFPFGKYEGKGVSQTALTVLDSVTGKGGWGYGYLHWAFHNMKTIGKGLETELERHITVLNDFQSVVPCQACHSPDPRLISLAFGYGSFFANGPYVYCNKEKCRRAIIYDKSLLVPLGFDALLKVAAFDKELQKASHETLRYIAGWPTNKKITEEAAADFIDELQHKNKRVTLQRKNLDDCLNLDDFDPENWERLPEDDS